MEHSTSGLNIRELDLASRKKCAFDDLLKLPSVDRPPGQLTRHVLRQGVVLADALASHLKPELLRNAGMPMVELDSELVRGEEGDAQMVVRAFFGDLAL